jgi:hypothetical protein
MINFERIKYLGDNMNLLLIFYTINSILLILHEMESAYEKEWEILKIPGEIIFFLIIHVPILVIIFLGIVWIERQTFSGYLIASLIGIGGTLPFFIHKVIMTDHKHFNLKISNLIIYLNLLFGLTTVFLSLKYIL